MAQERVRAAGPAWSNSLFEDNAEFGMGFRLGRPSPWKQAEITGRLRDEVGDELVDAILDARRTEESEIQQQRERVEELKYRLELPDRHRARRLCSPWPIT